MIANSNSIDSNMNKSWYGSIAPTIDTNGQHQQKQNDDERNLDGLPPSPNSVSGILPVQLEEEEESLLHVPRKKKGQHEDHDKALSPPRRHPFYNERLRDFAGVAGNVLEWCVYSFGLHHLC